MKTLPVVRSDYFSKRNRHHRKPRRIRPLQAKPIDNELVLHTFFRGPLAWEEQPRTVGLVRHALEFAFLSEPEVLRRERNVRVLRAFAELVERTVAVEEINVIAGNRDR